MHRPNLDLITKKMNEAYMTGTPPRFLIVGKATWSLVRLELYGTEVTGIVFGEHNAFHGLTVVQIDGDYIDFGW